MKVPESHPFFVTLQNLGRSRREFSQPSTGSDSVMNWIILIVAGFCEVGFTYCLGRAKSVEGLVWWGWIAGFLVFTVLSMGLLAKATQSLPIGTAYAVWTGIGAVGTVLAGILFFHEHADVPRAVFHIYADIFNYRA